MPGGYSYGADVAIPTDSIVARFDAQARRAPESVAVIDGDRQTTYGALQTWAEDIAFRLVGAGVKVGDPVGMFIERGTPLIAAMLGILKAGGAYVPLEPSSPIDRLAVIAKDASIRCVIAAPDAALDALGIAEPTVVAHEPSGSPNIGWEFPDVVGTDEAFVVFTSGSTGRPKGVPLSHRALLNRLQWEAQEYPFDPDEIAVQRTTTNFVDHAAEIFGPLLAGVSLLIVRRDQVTRVQEFADLIARYPVRRIVLVPSLVAAMIDAVPDISIKLGGLRTLTVSGERLLTPVAQLIQRTLPDVELINIYGMSEAMADITVFATREPIPDPPPIGRPLPNHRIYVVHPSDQLCNPGQVGEIRVSGPSLTSGYWKRPDLTAERFSQNPHGEGIHGRWFATGDLGRWNENGQLEYLGRNDDQVKIRGVRIELGEIEAAIHGIPGVVETAVVAAEREGETILAAFVQSSISITATEIKAALEPKLLTQMMPTVIEAGEKLPRLASGKIDRKRLSEQITERSRSPIPDHEMTQLWAEVAGLDVRSADDDFFEIGGHSLLAVRLLALVRERYGKDLTLDALVSAPTPRRLALRVDSDDAGPVPLTVEFFPRSPQALKTLHVIHGIGGNALNIRPLAKQLMPEIHVVAFQAPAVDGFTPPPSEFAELVDTYVQELIETSGDEPLALAGYSGGGLIALPMAKALEAADRRVDRVFLLDTYHPRIRPQSVSVRHHFNRVLTRGPGYVRERMRDRSDRRQRAANRAEGSAVATAGGVVPLELREEYLESWLGEILDGVAPTDPGTSTTLLRAESIPTIFAHLPADNGWGDVIADLTVISTPGSHDNFLLAPHVETLAGTIRSSLVGSAAGFPEGPE